MRATLSAVLGLWIGAAAAQVEAPAGSGLRFSGFGSVGVVHADAPAGWGFRRDISQAVGGDDTQVLTDSRLGLQLNYAPLQQVEFVGQLLLTHRAPYAATTDGVEWAFASYRPQPDVTLRLGRVNLDQFLMSDYRNVGFAFLFARPPVEFYGSLPTSLDGTDVAKVWNIDGTQWRAKLFFGRTRIGDLQVGESARISPAYGLMVAREVDGLLLRAGVSRARVVNALPALVPLLNGLAALDALPAPDVVAGADAFRSQLDVSGQHGTYSTLAMSYDKADWLLSAELARSNGQQQSSYEAGYAAIGRRIGQVTAYAGLSRIHSASMPATEPSWTAELTPLLGPAGAQQVQALGVAAADAVNMSSANQRTVMMGARWDIQPRMALKLQWDNVAISKDGGRLWAHATSDAGQANVFSAVLDFVF